MSIAALSYISAVVSAGSTEAYLKQGDVGHLFRSEDDERLWSFVDHHVRTYGKLPLAETILHHAKVVLPEVGEPAPYYLDLLRKAYVQVAIFDAGKSAEYLIKDKDPLAALDSLRQSLSKIDAHQMQAFVTDYRGSADLLKIAYKKVLLNAGNSGLQFGWPTLDAMAGGLVEGDLISLCGRPGLGKSFYLLYMALAMWKQGKPPLFISMEMNPISILQRLSAIDAKKAIGDIKGGTLTTYARTGYYEALSGLKDKQHPFWVVDGNLKATVSDIQSLAMQLKPGVILIDGAYLLKHPTERDRFRRVAENVDLIKMNLAPIAPTLASWQFNRDSKKLKAGEQPGLEHIGYSDAIGTHSSLVMGLFEEESVETNKRRKISILKGRNGEEGHFMVNWNFDHTTDFSEIDAEDVEDVHY